MNNKMTPFEIQATKKDDFVKVPYAKPEFDTFDKRLHDLNTNPSLLPNQRLPFCDWTKIEKTPTIQPLSEKPLSEKPLFDKPLSEKPLFDKPPFGLTNNLHDFINIKTSSVNLALAVLGMTCVDYNNSSVDDLIKTSFDTSLTMKVDALNILLYYKKLDIMPLQFPTNPTNPTSDFSSNPDIYYYPPKPYISINQTNPFNIPKLFDSSVIPENYNPTNQFNNRSTEPFNNRSTGPSTSLPINSYLNQHFI
jgi:hypothetical protein